MRNFLSWILAITIGFVFTNIVTFGLYRGAGWIELDGAPTDAITTPNSVIVQSQEGYGILTIDANGYVNPCTNLSRDGYILSMGSSMTKDSHNMMDNHYTAILNNKLGGTNEVLKVYNIGQDGATFDSMAKNFPAAVGEFDDAEAITMEFCIIGIDEDELSNGFKQNEWKPGAFKNINLSNSQKFEIGIKKHLPFVAFFIKNCLYKIDLSFDGAFGIGKKMVEESVVEFNSDAYERYYRDALSSIREGFDGQIILVYIPGIYLDNNGMQVNETLEKDLLLRVAQEYDIDVLNPTDVFLKKYSENYTFPTGYWNTSYGPGHLNAVGNQIVADEIYKVLEVK